MYYVTAMAAYSPDRMYNAPKQFAAQGSFLRQLKPTVLHLDRPAQFLHLPVPPVNGPETLGVSARNQPVRSFNPSIAEAPPGLCPRCAYVAAIRVDSQHQCDPSSPYITKPKGYRKRVSRFAWFRATALAVLDDHLELLGWTWLLNAPHSQLKAMHNASSLPSSAQADLWLAKIGDADAFAPPWVKPVFDVRLLNMDGNLLATMTCTSACAFSVLNVHLTASTTLSGGLVQLRAWVSGRYASPHAEWMMGRNQALFVGPSASQSDAPPSRPLMVQPWLGLIGSLGQPLFVRKEVSCYEWLQEPNKTAVRGSTQPLPGVQSIATALPVTGHRAGSRDEAFKLCGSNPPGAVVRLNAIDDGVPSRKRTKRAFGQAALLHNHTASLSSLNVGGSLFHFRPPKSRK